MTPRVGSGWRQQAILRLMRDGRPRTARIIGQKIGLEVVAAGWTVRAMGRKGWLCDSGERGYYRAQMWVITAEGRRIPVEGPRSSADGTPPG